MSQIKETEKDMVNIPGYNEGTKQKLKIKSLCPRMRQRVWPHVTVSVLSDFEDPSSRLKNKNEK